MTYETVALLVAIGGQYLILFSLYQKITTVLFETRMCPMHQKIGKTLQEE
ncbi:hypothetical protein [Methanoculleus frigidifontis]|nr:hypothetical protein [Methanoculleus sp. FWC-SCC1]